MKKINIFIPIMLALVSMALSSCDDFLDKLPDNRAELDTPDKIKKLMVSAYPDADPIIFLEMMTDNVDDYGPTNPNSDRFVEQVYNWEDVTEDDNNSPYRYWVYSYSGIVAANTALEAIEKLGGPEAMTTTENINKLRQTKGEALLLRAYSHFMLVNIFCMNYNKQTSNTDPGIPYLDHVEQQLNLHHDRGTVAEVYEKIERDIEEGINLVGDDYQVPKYHMNSKAAYAFAARFYLYYEKWDKVVEYATKCLGSDPSTQLRDWKEMSQMTSNFEAYGNHFIDASLKCNLLLCTSVSSSPLAFGPYYIYKRFAHGNYLATNEDMLSPRNIWGNKDMFWTSPKQYSATNLNLVCMWKLPFLFEYTDPVAQIGYRRTVYPLFTTDETLLNRAEAYIMLKEYDKAAADLTTWMQNITKSTKTLTPGNIKSHYTGAYVNYAYSDENHLESGLKKHLNPAFEIDEEGSIQECMLQCVLAFRRIETIQQGLRWFDIKRYGIEIPRRQMDESDRPAKLLDWLGKDDPRRAVQIPLRVRQGGLEPNPRSVETETSSDKVEQIPNSYIVK